MLTGELAGAGPALLALGAFAGWAFLILAVVFFAMALYIELQTQCATHGMSVGECLDGMVEGFGWLKVFIGLSQVGIFGAAAVAGSCVAELGLKSLTATEVFSRCPVPPKGGGDEKCEDELPDPNDFLPEPDEDSDDESDLDAGGLVAGATSNKPQGPRNGQPPGDVQGFKAGAGGKAGATDVPSWVKQNGYRPLWGESPTQFAKRVLDDWYGAGHYDKGGGSEYSQVEKYGSRHFDRNKRVPDPRSC
jgi:hypothetical protein